MNLITNVKKFLKTSLVLATILSVGAFSLPANAAEINLGGPQDCDANAVIYCGAQTSSSLVNKYNNGTSQNSAKSIQDIFAKFGISSAEVNAIPSTAVAGRVTKSGEVFVNTSSAAVATGAITAGRQNISGSTAVTHNGTSFFTRPPSVSFNSASLPAFVVMKEGVFQYAVISSCANPVSATPKTPPAPDTAPKATINKTVAVKGSQTFTKDVTVKSGSAVVYKIDIASTGTEAATNVVVKDVLPARATYIAGTLTRDGVKVSADEANKLFSAGGYTIASIANGKTVSYRFEATIGQVATDTSCKKEVITNKGIVTATEIPATESTATVNKECEPVKPMVVPPVCNDFEIKAGDNRVITVTKVDYTANGATFVNAVFNWDVNKTNNSSAPITDASKLVGQTHQYAADGTYLVGVTLTFTQDGKTVTANGPECQQQVAFTTKTPPVVTSTTPTPPVTLVAAGPATTIASFVAFAAVAGGAYYWSLRRRLSL
ncbi:MAG: hypothetical protein JWO69_1963 [Thermoleophilia bacterium]|nr:hypothetical protein [Thermoleophilia bacterium]